MGGWSGFQNWRRVVRTLVGRRATRLDDDHREEKEQFKNFEVHILSKETSAPKASGLLAEPARIQSLLAGHFAGVAVWTEFIASWRVCRVLDDNAPVRI